MILRLIAMLGVLTCTPFFAVASDNDAASSINSMTKAKMGSKDSITNNIVNPLSGSGELSSMNDKSKFTFKLSTCDASETLFKVLTQPLSSGKLKLVSITQDTTTGGELNEYFNVNKDVDIVCSNGFMTCSDVDNFATCNSYLWSTTGGSTAIGITQTGMGDLGGCYCISGKCGRQLAWRNMDEILTDVGSGIAHALAAANPYYTMSGVIVDGTTVTVTGGDPTCAATTSSDLVTSTDKDTLLSFNNDQSKLTSSAESATKTNTAYELLTGGSLNPQETAEVRSCTVTRSPALDAVSLKDIITFDSGEGGVQTCGNDCIQLVLGKVGDNYWKGNCKIFEVSSRFYIKDKTRIKSADLIRAKFDDWIQINLNDNYIWSGPYNNWTGTGGIPGKCELETEWDKYPNKSFLDKIENGSENFKIRVMVGGKGEGYAYAKLTADLTCKDKGQDLDVISDTCKVYQADPDCTLEEENVDGVTTYSSGAITGLSPITQTKNISEDMCQISIQRPWFKKTRKYRCNVKTNSDLTNIITRSKTIHDSTTATSYQDLQFTNSGTVKDSGKLNFSAITSVGTCAKVCKVRKPVYPDVTLQGVDVGVVKPDHYDISYRDCSVVGDTCPLSDGEEVVTQCQCSNDFAEATALMQVMRMAGQDMICSTGEKNSPN